MYCPKCGTENPEEGKYCRKCGTDLAGISRAIGGETHTGPDQSGVGSGSLTDPSGHDPSHYDPTGRRKWKKSNNPDDLYAAGVRSTIFGIGFLIISMVLFFTNVAGGHSWWWAMLFPAFAMISGGVGNIAKAMRLEKRMIRPVESAQQKAVPEAPVHAALEQGKTDYVPADRASKFDTGDLVPPSVVENTTRHLEMDSEGETMTLPDVKETGK